MKLATNSGATYPISLNNGFGAYSAVPTSYTKVASRESGTDAGSGATGAELTTTYAAFMKSGQEAGTYSGKVKYTMVHPANESAPPQPQQPTAGCISYFANASTAEGTMGCQSVTDGRTVTLFASNFSRTGYGFAGWSDAFDYATNPNAHFYGPHEDITVPTGTTANGLALYAVWVKSTGNLQDANKVASLCGTGEGALTQAPTDGTANLTSVSALTDLRDSQTYAIAKLADGKCWMVENLRLDNQYTVGNNQTDPSVTNASLSQGYNPSFIGLADPESTNFDNGATPNSLYTTETGVEGKNTISGSNQDHRFPRYNNSNTSQRAKNTTNTNVNTYSYGNYYTWAAVIADTTNYATNNQGVTATSICPTGWTLPRGGDKNNEVNNDYWNLVVNGINNGTKPANYGSRTYPNYIGNPEGSNVSMALRSYPTNFLYSGYFSISSASSRGSFGSYWSSTADALYSYRLSLNSTDVYPGTSFQSKYFGSAARCVLGP